MRKKLLQGVSQKEFIVKVVYDELVKFLGGEKTGIEVDKSKKPFKIMMIGLFGSGKTTQIGKLLKFYQKRGFNVGAIGLDVHRPAAPEQLEQICKRIEAKCFIMKGEKDPLKIYKAFEKILQSWMFF